MKRTIALIAGFAFLICLGSGCAVFKDKEKTLSTSEVRKLEGIPVKVAESHKKELSNLVHITGTILMPEEVNITPQVGGKVIALYKDKGDYVKKGQALLQIEKDDYEIGLRQAEAALKMAQENLRMARTGARPEELDQANNMVAQAEANFNVISKTYGRMKELYEKGVISKQDLDGTEAQYIAAEKNYDSAKKSLEVAQTGAREEQIKILEAQEAQAKAAVDNVKLQLERTEVKSPVSGVISYRMAKEGEMIGSSNAIFQILTDGNKKISFTVNENDIHNVKNGQIVEFRATGIPNKVFKAEVSYVSKFVRKMTREAEGEAVVIGDSDELSHGMFVEGEISLDKDFLFAIPFKSLVQNKFVYLVKDGLVETVECNRTKRIGDFVLILDNCFQEGDTIVIEGQGLANSGDKVDIIETLEY